MRDDVKKILGICNDDFDDIIDGYIASAKKDLEMVGVSVDEADALISTAIKCYVCGMIDEENHDRWFNSYAFQKDGLRHYESYKLSV